MKIINKKILSKSTRLRSKVVYLQITRGFTLVEMLVVAPIVLLVIGVFIATIVNMTGDVLSTRNANDLAYNIQDTLSRIEQDVKLSGGFLSTNNITINSPQGYNDDTTNFHNIDATTGTMLILNSYTTIDNPLGTTPNILYASGQPNPCDSELVSKNQPVMMNVVYFVKNNTLWRRTLAQSNYETIGCSKPWQQPSCALNIVNAFCKTTDLQLIDGVNASTGFTISYYPDATSTTPNAIASDSNQNDTARQSALKSTNTATISITAAATIAGRQVSQSGSIRVTSPNNNTNPTSITTVIPTILSQPQNKTVLHGENVKILAAAAGTSPTVQWQQSTNQGVSWTDISGATSPTLTISPATNVMDGYQYHAVFTNSAGSVTSSAARLTVNSLAWASLALQNGWTTYDATYNSPSYIKTSDGVVVLKGLIKNSGTPTDGQVIATLPVSYRPSANLIFPAVTYPNNYARIDINANGEIIFRAGGSASWLSLENIRFVPDTGRYTRTAISSFLNGWSNFGGSYAPVSYVVDNSERIDIQGLMNVGTLTDNTVIFKGPAKSLSQYLHVPAAGGTFGDFGINLRHEIVAKGSGSSWLSLQAMYYPSTYNNWSNLTLINSWVAYGGTYSTPQYTKAADKLVTLKGLITAGATANSTIIATLPVGYRPSGTIVYTCVSVNAFCRIDIDTNGNIMFETGSNTWLSLDNITFYADK